MLALTSILVVAFVLFSLIILIHMHQARIALERRRFLEDAATAVRRQGMWSNIAHEITAEYRSLCAEEV